MTLLLASAALLLPLSLALASPSPPHPPIYGTKAAGNSYVTLRGGAGGRASYAEYEPVTDLKLEKVVATSVDGPGPDPLLPFGPALVLSFRAFNTSLEGVELRAHLALAKPGGAQLSVDGGAPQPLRHRAYEARLPGNGDGDSDSGWVRLTVGGRGLDDFHAHVFHEGALYSVVPLHAVPARHARRLSAAGATSHAAQLVFDSSSSSSDEFEPLRHIKRMLQQRHAHRRRRLALMPDFMRPDTYEGPYGRMQSNCPAVQQALRISFAVDPGYYEVVTRDVSGSAQDKLDHLEADIVYILNLCNVLYADQINIVLVLDELVVYTTNQMTAKPFGKPGSCYDTEGLLDAFTTWRKSKPYGSAPGAVGLWHLMTNCHPPPGTVGLAWGGVTCYTWNGNVNYQTGWSNALGDKTWQTVAHEIGHGLGAMHTFSSNGIMDYVQRPEYKFTKNLGKDDEGVVQDNYDNVCDEVASASCLYDFVATCGNGVVEPGEDCDDGQNVGGTLDCCSSSCTFADPGYQCSYKYFADPSLTYEVDGKSSALGQLTNDCCHDSGPQKCQFKPSTSACVVMGADKVSGEHPDTAAVGYCSNGHCTPEGETVCDIYVSTRFTESCSAPAAGNECRERCWTGSSCQQVGPPSSFTDPHLQQDGFVQDGTVCIDTSGTYSVCNSGSCVPATPPSTGGGGGTPTPTLSVSAPVAGATWVQGSSYTVQWSSTDLAASTSVKIELLRSGSVAATVTASTSNDGSYVYTVSSALVAQSGYSARVTSLSSSSTFAASGQFSVEEAPSVAAVTAPAGGARWNKGSSQTIRWTTTGSVASVLIALVRGDALVQTLSSSTSNDGAYTVGSVSSGLTNSADYRVVVADASNTALNAISSAFEINDAPSLAVVAPTGGQTWVKGSTVSVSWTSAGIAASENVAVQLLRGWSSVVSTLSAATPNDGSLTGYTVPGSLDAAGDYRVKVAYGSSASALSDAFSVIEEPEPDSLAVVAPGATTTWVMGDAHTVSWTATGTGISTVSVKLYLVSALVATIATSTANDGSYTWTVPASGLDASAFYRVRLQGGAVSVYSSYFRIDPRPALSVDTPATDLVVGSSYVVSWTSVGIGSSENVALHLLRGGSLVATLSAATPNDGSFTYKVADDIGVPAVGAADYSLRVAYGVVVGESSTFTIRPAPRISLAAPAAGAAWYRGQQGRVMWTTEGSVERVNVELRKGAALFLSVATGATNTGSLYYSVPADAPLAADYSVRVTSSADASVSDTSSAFSIEDLKTIALVSPDTGGVIVKGSKYGVQWTATGELGTVRITLHAAADPQEQLAVLSAGEASTSGVFNSFVWNVPAGNAAVPVAATGAYRVRVTSNADGSVTNTGGAFTVEAEARVTAVVSPAEGSVWKHGQARHVSWTTQGAVPSVLVELVRGGSAVLVIGEAVEEDSVPWTVPISLAAADGYAVRVTSTANPAVTKTSATFSVAVAEDTLTLNVVAPTDSSSVSKGKSFVVRWSFSGEFDAVKIELLQSGVLHSVLSASTSNDGAFEWAVGAGPGNEFAVRVSKVGGSVVSATGAPFSILAPQPVVSLTDIFAGQDGAGWARGKTAQIAWTSNGVGNLKIELFQSSSRVLTIAASVPAATGSPHKFEVPTTTPPATGTGYKVVISSVENPTVTDESPAFSIKDDAFEDPEAAKGITVTEPAVDSVWTPTQEVRVVWTHTGAISTVDIDLFAHGSFDRFLAQRIDNSGSLTFVVPSDLAPSGGYSVRVSDGAGTSGDSATFAVVAGAGSTLEVTSPAAGARFTQGDEVTLAWRSDAEAAGGATVEVLDAAGARVALVSAAAPAAGSVRWTVPFEAWADGDGFTVCVSHNGGGVKGTSGAFGIRPKRSLAVVAPEAGVVWTKGSNYYARWTHTGWADYNVSVHIVRGDAIVVHVTPHEVDMPDAGVPADAGDSFDAGGTGKLYYELPLSTSSLPGPATDYKVKVTSLVDGTVQALSSPFTVVCAWVQATLTFSATPARTATQIQAAVAAATRLVAATQVRVDSVVGDGPVVATLTLMSLPDAAAVCPTDALHAIVVGTVDVDGMTPEDQTGATGGELDQSEVRDVAPPGACDGLSGVEHAWCANRPFVYAIAGALLGVIALLALAVVAERRRRQGKAGLVWGKRDPAWRKTKRVTGGQKYFFNAQTGATQWERPSGKGKTGETPRSGAGSDILPGWEAAWSSEGELYYVNYETGESSWDPPLRSASDTVAPYSPVALPSPSGFGGGGDEGGGGNDQAPLPHGWFEATTEDNDLYFYHEDTGETSWQRPAGAEHVVLPSVRSFTSPGRHGGSVEIVFENPISRFFGRGASRGND